jgi:chlorophyllide a reductase subunit Z
MIGGGVTPEGTASSASCRAPSTRTSGSAPTARCTGCGPSTACARCPSKPRAEGRKPRVNIIGPSYGTFNMPERPGRDPPPGRGHRRRGEHGVPARQPPGRRARWLNADVNICMYREFGRMLCEALERPYLQAPIGLHSTTAFLREAGRADWGSTPSPSSSARSTPRSSRCGICGARSRRTSSAPPASRSWPTKPTPRHAPLPRGRAGLPCNFAVPRKPGAKTDNDAVREGCHEQPPLVMFGSYNERMYLAESGAASVPSRRTSRRRSPARSSAATPARPSWATPARPIWCRSSATRCSTRCSTSCRWAPTSTASTPRRHAVQREPVLVQISTAKRLRDRAESMAREAGAESVTRELMARVAGTTQEAAS